MNYIESNHPPGTVAYITANNVRYGQFYDCLETIRVPLGTILVKSTDYNSARNRNEVASLMKGEWILFLDDDHTWSPSLAFDLLDRQVDIVGPPYCRRFAPFDTVGFECYHPESFNCPKREEDHVWWPATWENLSNFQELVELEACGFGAVLVRKKVIEGVSNMFGECLFRVGPYDNTWLVPRVAKDEMNEDMGFCWAARKAGFKVYWDMRITMGHITNTALTPWRGSDGRIRIVSNIDGHKTWITR